MISSREIQAIVKFWLGIGESRPLMQIERPTIIYRCWLGLLLLLGQLYSPAAVTAETRIVVVPLGGNDVEQHPVGTTYTNASGMSFNLLPAGSFTMGSRVKEFGRNSDETEHWVNLSKPFYMQTTEVTNKQWNDFVDTNPSNSHTVNPAPVETVNWYEAVYFANRVSASEGKSLCYVLSNCSITPPGAGMTCATVGINTSCTGYRLPTEAEWEYAARATTTTVYANDMPVKVNTSDKETGSGFNRNLHVMGWYAYNNVMENAGGDTEHPNGTKLVARKQANAWGLYDMHGNVLEWVQDWYAASYGGAATDPMGIDFGTKRVLRGGHWAGDARLARSAARSYLVPNFRWETIGFRLVMVSDK